MVVVLACEARSEIRIKTVEGLGDDGLCAQAHSLPKTASLARQSADFQGLLPCSDLDILPRIR
jgi:hypothetical protein